MKLKTTEKGFTLLELLVALSIAAFVTAAASMTIITMMRLSPKTNNWAIALRQVQNAGYWISRDVQMSKGTITVGTGTPTFLALILPQTPTDNKTIVYRLDNMSAGGLKRLMRNDSGQQIMVAEYISIPTSPVYNSDNRTLTFTIEATLGNTDINRAEVIRQYEAMQRLR